MNIQFYTHACFSVENEDVILLNDPYLNGTAFNDGWDLIVDGIEWGRRVKVKSGNASTIDCFYVVYGTRKDVPPLEVEQDA